MPLEIIGVFWDLGTQLGRSSCSGSTYSKCAYSRGSTQTSSKPTRRRKGQWTTLVETSNLAVQDSCLRGKCLGEHKFVSYYKWNHPKIRKILVVMGYWVGGRPQLNSKRFQIERPKTRGALTKRWTSYNPSLLLFMEMFFVGKNVCFVGGNLEGKNHHMDEFLVEIEMESNKSNPFHGHFRTGTTMLQL